MDLEKARKDLALAQEELRLATQRNDELVAVRDTDLMNIQRLADDVGWRRSDAGECGPLIPFRIAQKRLLQSQLEEARSRATAATAVAAAAATIQMTTQAIPAPPAAGYGQAITQLELDGVISGAVDSVVSQERLASYRAAAQDLVKASQ